MMTDKARNIPKTSYPEQSEQSSLPAQTRAHKKKTARTVQAASSLAEIGSGNPRKIPDTVDAEEALAYNQNSLAIERTEFAKIRTDLALTNSRLAIDRTHLSYLRTIVTLAGSGATLHEALPLLGVSSTFSNVLSCCLFLVSAYFIYKDASTYPKLKKRLAEMEARADRLARETEDRVYLFDPDEEQNNPAP